MQEVGFEVTSELHHKTTGLSTELFLDYCYNEQPWQGVTKQELADKILHIAHDWIPERSGLMPGVVELLEVLKEQNIRMAVASASPMEIIEAVLTKRGIKHYFELWHSATLEVHSKPHPAVYTSAINLLKESPDACIAFEDSWPGVQAAKAAGTITIAVPSAQQRYQERFKLADYIIGSLHDFKALPIIL
jgi:sugar-phosphatase